MTAGPPAATADAMLPLASIRTADGVPVAQVETVTPEWRANRDLIIAAPKLLAACEAALEKFAEYYGYRDPAHSGRFLSLKGMVDRGIIHEVWFLALQGNYGAPYESIEVKQAYDAQFRKRPRRNKSREFSLS